MSGSSGTKRSLREQAVEQYVTKKTPQTQTEEQQDTAALEEEKFADIESNPFFQAVTQNADPEVAAAEIKKLLSATEEFESEKEFLKKLEELQTFKEYLMLQRENVSVKIIELSNTDAFAELQSVIGDMNDSLKGFNDRMEPLMEILDAVARLNALAPDKIYDVMNEINEDKEAEEELAAQKEQWATQLQSNKAQQSELNADISVLRNEKKFFGMFGGPSDDALRQAALKNERIKELQDQAAKLQDDIQNKTIDRETEYGEYAEEKAKLRELLDLTSEEHKGRQKELVQAALDFVSTTKSRTGAVLNHFESIQGQIEGIEGINGKMREAFTVVTAGIEGAVENNLSLTEKFGQAAESESELQKLKREKKLTGLQRVNEEMNRTHIDTNLTASQLAKEELEIRTMRETNTDQIDSTRRQNTSGVAQVASRLSVVLTAISSAALNESRTAIHNTLHNMETSTGAIAQNEAIKNATNVHKNAALLADAIAGVAEYTETAKAAAQITEEGYYKNLAAVDDLQANMKKLGESVGKIKSAATDAANKREAEADAAEEQKTTPAANKPKNAFTL